MRVIGVDPDSEKHGVAIYIDGVLTTLAMWSLMDFLKSLEGATDTIISMENTLANNFLYAMGLPDKLSPAQKAKINQDRMRKTGRCQQAQMELMRLLDYLDIPYQLHKPMKGNWADTKLKGQFERVTGWTGASNQDTRSAAFFGFLLLRKQ